MFHALAITVVALTATSLPLSKTAATELSTPSLQHHEVLRIDRDFGKPQYDIVVDSWVDAGNPGTLADVRMWWVKTDSAHQRRPFSAKVMRYVDLEYRKASAHRWTVTFTGDRKQFRFDVQVNGSDAVAYTSVVTNAGKTIDHCRAESSRLRARRFLGIPVGIKEMAITCVGDDGRRHHGVAPFRKVKRGRVYQG